MLLSELIGRVDMRHADCWSWRGAHLASGYGSVRFDGRVQVVHRVMFELVHGPVAAGLQIDHLCRDRGCVNPKHLQAVPQALNLMRGRSMTAANASKTRCSRGHGFDATDTRGYRVCTTCKRARRRAHLERTGK